MTCVILFNLGGPDSLKAVRRFLYNMFLDGDLINLPKILRIILAWLVSTLRAKKVRHYYKLIGGGSPQIRQTEEQAETLQEALGDDFKVVVAFRYCHPLPAEALKKILGWDPERIVLVPLYPQYSRTTTGSFFNEFNRALRGMNKKHHLQVRTKEGHIRHTCYSSIPVHKINSYHNHPTYIKAMVENIQENLKNWSDYFFLFTAHSLPVSIIERGDPYKDQTEETVKLIMEHFPEVPYALGYQSRIGPGRWLEPSTIKLLEDLVSSGIRKIAIIPVSFTCENLETLYELDILYKSRVRDRDTTTLVRIPTLRNHPTYIRALKELIIQTIL